MTNKYDKYDALRRDKTNVCSESNLVRIARDGCLNKPFLYDAHHSHSVVLFIIQTELTKCK